jgi:hypothetical protein
MCWLVSIRASLVVDRIDLANSVITRYQDRLNDLGQTMSTAYVLEGGVKAWLLQYGDDESLVQRD